MMSPRGTHESWSLLAFLLALVAAGCSAGGDTADEKVGVAEQQVWAKVPGHHATDNPVPWEDTNLPWPASVTSSAASPDGPTTMSIVYRDAARRLRRAYQSDADGVLHDDVSVTSVNNDPADPRDGAPAVVAWGPNRLDVFWFQSPPTAGAPWHLWHKSWDGGWQHQEDIGPMQTEPDPPVPMVATWGAGHLDVFWRAPNGDLRRWAFDSNLANTPGHDAKGWTTQDALLLSGVSAQFAVAEPSAGEIHVVWRSQTTGLARHRFTTGNAWKDGDFGGAPAPDGPLTAGSWGPGRFDVIYTQTDSTSSKLVHKWWTLDTGWRWEVQATTEAGGPFPTSPPASLLAAAPVGGPNRLDLIVPNPTSGTALHTFYQESLPGFTRLSNPSPEHWCWANSAAMVINYLYQPYNGRGTAPTQTCEVVSRFLHYKNGTSFDCCNGPEKSTPDCLHGSSIRGELSGVAQVYFQDPTTTNPPAELPELAEPDYAGFYPVVTLAEIKHQIQQLHLPILIGIRIRNEDKDKDLGHVVVIRDVYRFQGVDTLVIANPADENKYSTIPYDDFFRVHYPEPDGGGVDPYAGANAWYPKAALYNLHLGGCEDAFAGVCDTDPDGDGVPSLTDNCRTVANPDQANADNDTFGDACDPCSLDYNNDEDEDGVCAVAADPQYGDNCPQRSNSDQANCNAFAEENNTHGDVRGDACDPVPCPEMHTEVRYEAEVTDSSHLICGCAYNDTLLARRMRS